MSKIKNGVVDQYSTGPFEQQFGTADIEGVKILAGFPTGADLRSKASLDQEGLR